MIMVDYKLTQLNVTIREVAIGNKRLTKTIFNQIEFETCFNEDMDFVGESIIGYVKDNSERFLLWVKEGKLRRSNLTPYYKLPKDATYAFINNVSWFLRKCKIEFDGIDDNNESVFNTVTDFEDYENLVAKNRKFLDSLVDQQVFL